MRNRDDRPIEEQMKIIEEALRSLTLRVTRLQAETVAAAIAARPPAPTWTPRIWIGTIQHKGEIKAVLPRRIRVQIPNVGSFVRAPPTTCGICKMADNAATAATDATAAFSTVSSVTTRLQQQRNNEKAAAAAASAHAATEDKDGNPTPASDNNRKKGREPFKGKSDTLSGNVFQLAAEGRKANQFLETIKTFRDYANVELDNPQDLAPWFDNPCKDVVIAEPTDEPPLSDDGTTRVSSRDHQKYIQ
jgi:hypothetical protein